MDALTCELLRPPMGYHHAGLTPQPIHGCGQEASPGGRGLDQADPGSGPGHRQDQSRQPTTGPQVGNPAIVEARRDDAELACMGEFGIEIGLAADESSPASVLQHLAEGGHRGPGHEASGRITTRRRGSSPSEVVMTPSISTMAS